MAFNITLDMKWIIIPVVIIIGLSVFNMFQFNNNKDLDTYSRQLAGNLTEMENELQAANHDAGILESKLLSEKELSKYWKNSKNRTGEEFEKFVEKHNLRVQSLDNTIAELKQQIRDGETDIVVSDGCVINEECVISYVWKDINGRFVLKDPNIFEKNNETFESKQIFSIKGVIAEQKGGSLQIRNIVLNEVVKGANGEYKLLPDAKADIVDSEFVYSNEPDSLNSNWYDVFRLRAIVLGSINMIPDAGNLRMGLGMNFFDWRGLGINTHTAFNFEDAKAIEQRIGFSYNPNLLNKELNLAIGVSAGTPFYKAFNEYSFNIDILFYITN